MNQVWCNVVCMYICMCGVSVCYDVKCGESRSPEGVATVVVWCGDVECVLM